MTRGTPHPDATPEPPGLDENGVDRAQIRQMLQLTPEERLRRAEEFLNSALEIREWNDTRTVR